MVDSSVSYNLQPGEADLTLTGSDSIDGGGNSLDNVIIGNSGDNKLFGYDGSDTLLGNAGNDYLDGGSGADQLTGGPGDDSYVVDDPNDVVTEVGGEGTDLVYSTASSFTLPDNVENLQLFGFD